MAAKTPDNPLGLDRYTWHMQGKTIRNVAMPQPEWTKAISYRGFTINGLLAGLPGFFFYRKDPLTGKGAIFPWTSKSHSGDTSTLAERAKQKDVATQLKDWQKQVEDKSKAVDKAQANARQTGYQNALDALRLKNIQASTQGQGGFDMSALMPIVLVFGLILLLKN